MSQLDITKFVDLPVQVSCNILSAWLTAKDVVCFDMACCTADLRDFLFKMWSSEQCLMKEIPSRALMHENTANSFLEWAIKRSVKVSTLHIPDWSNMEVLERFVSSVGKTVTNIEIDGDIDEVWGHFLLISTHCLNRV